MPDIPSAALRCDRCSANSQVMVQTFCDECGPTPLCPTCTTEHVIELDLERAGEH